MCSATPAHNVVADGKILVAIASSFVAPVARALAIACWPRCAANATSCAALSWSSAAFLATNYVAL